MPPAPFGGRGIKTYVTHNNIVYGKWDKQGTLLTMINHKTSQQWTLKHKDSFGKSENLSKIFFAEILVFDHDYEGKLSSSNGLLWISFIFYNNLFEIFSNCSEGLRTNLYTLSTVLCKVQLLSNR